MKLVFNDQLTDKCKSLETNLIKLSKMFDIPIYAYMKTDYIAEISVFKIQPEVLKKFLLGKMIEGRIRKGKLTINENMVEYNLKMN